MAIGKSIRNVAKVGLKKFHTFTSQSRNSWETGERFLNDWDKSLGRVPSQIYKMTPAYAIIEPHRQVIRTGLGVLDKIAEGMDERKPRKFIEAGAQFYNFNDQNIPIINQFVRNPLIKDLYESPYIQSKLGD